MAGGARPPRAVVRAAVRDSLADLVAGDRVLVALSGGADSLALCSATVRVGQELGLVVVAAVVDHGLQTSSAQVSARASAQALRLGCADAQVIRVEVPAGPGSGGPESAARSARYAALDKLVAEHRASAVLLGHTRDDQAETVLLGLARGSGTRSIAGMPARSGHYRRPLLGVAREVVAAAAAADAAADPLLAPWSDPHNDDPAYLRVRVRTRVLPEMVRALGPGVPEALARTAQLARDDAEALELWAGRELASRLVADPPAGAFQLHRDGLAELPRAVRTRVLRQFLIGAGCPPDSVVAQHVAQAEQMVLNGRSTSALALPGRRTARALPDRLDVRA